MLRRFLSIADPHARDGEGGEGGAGGEGGEGGAAGQGGGLLGDQGGAGGEGGAGGAGGAGGEDEEFTIPEKFLAKTADGAIDYQAVLKKALPAYTAMEKRMGSGEAPPKSADEYKLEPYLPEGSTIPPESEKRIFGDMHALGLNNKQLQGVMGLFGTYLGENIAQEKASMESAMSSLKTVWPGEGEYDKNLKQANYALKMLAPAPLYKSVTSDPKLMSNPALVQLLAAMGDELKEDTSREHLDDATTESIGTLKRSPAYLDTKHPDHKSVVAQVSEAYSKGYKDKK